MIDINNLPLIEEETAEFRQTFYTAYGNQMQRRRKTMGWSLSDLSKQLQIPEQDLAEYEYGKPVPIIECIAIYKALGMKPEITSK